MATSTSNESAIKPSPLVPMNKISHRCRETTKTSSRPAVLELAAGVFVFRSGDLGDKGWVLFFIFFCLNGGNAGWQLLNKDRLRRRSCTKLASFTYSVFVLVSSEVSDLIRYSRHINIQKVMCLFNFLRLSLRRIVSVPQISKLKCLIAQLPDVKTDRPPLLRSQSIIFF